MGYLYRAYKSRLGWLFTDHVPLTYEFTAHLWCQHPLGPLPERVMRFSTGRALLPGLLAPAIAVVGPDKVGAMDKAVRPRDGRSSPKIVLALENPNPDLKTKQTSQSNHR